MGQTNDRVSCEQPGTGLDRRALPLKRHFLCHLNPCGFPIFSSPDFAQNSGIPRASAARLLGNLADKGLLEILQEGKGKRPTIYRFSELISIFSGKNEEPRKDMKWLKKLEPRKGTKGYDVVKQIRTTKIHERVRKKEDIFSDF